MFENNIGASFHADVISAMPNDDNARNRLIEEIKNRAKSSIKSSNYPDAVKLYTKAIDTSLEKDSKHEESSMKDLAILYANKSMCELAMKHYENALHDADNAIRYDGAYLKGYYRKAMVLIETKQYSLAKDCLFQGLTISPNEKDFITQMKRIDELASSAPAVIIPSKPVSTSFSATTTTSNKPKSTTSTTSTSSTATRKATSSTGKDMDDDEEDVEQLGLSRGYRKTADGRVTTFFNHELDDHTKSLIGDIAPKKLDGVDNPAVAVTANDSSTTSVWNSAGTYEERIFTPWATDRLKEVLIGGVAVRCGKDDMMLITVKEVSSIKGDAQISMIRGKRKHIYDYSIDVAVVGRRGDEMMVEGNVLIEDVTADMEYEITANLKASSGVPISNEEIKMMKKAVEMNIKRLLQTFDVEFKMK